MTNRPTPPKNRYKRSAALIAVFCFICAVFFVRLVHFQIVSKEQYAPANASETVETVTIEAVRGNICDRNGTVLVSSQPFYSFILDYNTMPESKSELNRLLLTAYNAMRLNGVTSKESLCPFVGNYPYFEFSSKLTEGSAMYNEYVRLIEKNYVTSKYPIEQALAELTAADVARYYARRFEIVEEVTLEDGGLGYYSDYTPEEIAVLVALRYEIDRVGIAPDTPFVLAEGISYEFYTYAIELSGVTPGLNGLCEYRRVYHYPGYASHILGLTGQIYAEDWEYYKALGYGMTDKVGISGCEAIFEEYLRGINGSVEVYKNGDGKVIRTEVTKEAVAGSDVWLTIDIDVQIAAENALKDNIEDIASSATVTHGGEDASSGAAIAIDPNSGELLAIASYPSYDLTTYNKDYASLLSNPDSPLLNRALQTTLAPGSTFKVGVAAAALESGKITKNYFYACKGWYERYGSTDAFKCAVHPMNGYVTENVFDALSISCNCFFYEMGHLMGIDLLNQWCTLYGLGQPTGIELYEKTGILAGDAYRKAHPEFCQINGLGNWSIGDTWQAAIGQSENAFTPLQVAVYISTVINGGTRYGAHLLHSVHKYGGETVREAEKTVLSEANISDSTLSIIKSAMVDVISGPETVYAIRKNFDSARYTVGGKTGTAQAGSNASNNAWFTAFAPVESPKITVSVMIEHGSSGSYASYTARKIMDAYLVD